MRTLIKRYYIYSFICLTITMGFISLFNYVSYADGDNLAPVITSVQYDNRITTPNILSITYTITEEGVGANRISFEFVYRNGNDVRTIDIDDQSFINQPRFTGTYTVNYEIPESQAGGVYYLVYASCWDQNNNVGRLDLSSHWSYGGSGTDDNKVNNGDTSLEIVDAPGRDSTAPSIIGVEFNNQIQAPTVLTITYTVKEDGVGANRVIFDFVKFENDKLKEIYIDDQSFSSRKSGTYTVNYNIPASQQGGTYYLVSASCWDQNNNVGRLDLSSHWSYGGSGTDDNKVNNGDTSLEIVDAPGRDNIAPEITEVSFSKSITTPDTLTITYTIKEEGIGANRISFEFVKKEGSDIRTIEVDDQSFSSRKTGTYTVKTRIPTSQASGTYYLVYGSCWDQNDNVGRIDLTSHWNYGGSGTDDGKVNNGDTALEVADEFNPEFESFITNESLVERLNSMRDDGIALIGYSDTNSIASKSLFETIAGTNKTIVFQNNGYQWIVKGIDIVNECKDIDLKIDATVDNASNFGAEPTQIVLIKFADNGALPGQMTVRAKVSYILGQDAKLYYYNNDTWTLENSDSFGFFDGPETWCETTITHNSIFLLSNSTLVAKKASRNTVSKINTVSEIVDLPTVKILKPKAAKKKVTVKWKKPSKKNLKKIQGIEIRVAGAGVDKYATAGKKKTSKKISGLTSKNKYTVWVRAYAYVNGVKHVSVWKSKSVKVK